MQIINLLFLTIIQIISIDSAIFLWSNKEIDISPLQKFTNDDLSRLVDLMDNPKVMIYSNPYKDFFMKLETLVNNSFSAYNTNDDLDEVDNKALTGDIVKDLNIIENDVEDAKRENQNVLFLVISPNDARYKRDLEDEELPTGSPKFEDPVVFIGESKTDKKYGIIYSSTPFLLRINKTDLYITENENDLSSVDTVPRESITRLNINKLLPDKSKIKLEFIFSWVDSYWYLTAVRISGTSYNMIYNLVVDKEVFAPVRFSYHCSGETVFSDTVNDVYLYLNNMQVQIDSLRESFGDAYDCISFTTAPIWSGIFVSSLLLVVLLISLVALWDIKTMDKFDNQKTKQLTITVNE